MPTLEFVASRSGDPTLARKRHLARADRLKRRATAASVLGFVALFGLAAQHVVRGASASTRQVDASARRTAATSSTAFFDQQDSGFSFGDTASALPQEVAPASAPMAQTSVS